jgi:hypothetical protein
VIDYSFDPIEQLPEITTTAVSGEELPGINQLNVNQKKIFFGDLCEDETTSIKVVISNADQTINVFLVYRLSSSAETSRNWITKKMDNTVDNVWLINLNAENDFNSYQLINGAKVEYSVSVLYGIDGVVSSPTFNDISVYQCLGK